MKIVLGPEEHLPVINPRTIKGIAAAGGLPEEAIGYLKITASNMTIDITEGTTITVDKLVLLQNAYGLKARLVT